MTRLIILVKICMSFKELKIFNLLVSKLLAAPDWMLLIGLTPKKCFCLAT